MISDANAREPVVIRLILGAAIMVAALGLQMAMVIRLIEPDIGLALAGYLLLFVGMVVALTGLLARRR